MADAVLSDAVLSDTVPLLDVGSIDVHYGRRRNKRQVLSGVSLQVRAGEIVGLIGESGSGKSTVARAIIGLAPVTAGQITVAGNEVTKFRSNQWRSFRRRGFVQYVFQDPLRSQRQRGRRRACPGHRAAAAHPR